MICDLCEGKDKCDGCVTCKYNEDHETNKCEECYKSDKVCLFEEKVNA